MIKWLKSLFEGNNKKRRTILDREDVKRIEENISSYNRDVMCEYYGISKTTYYSIKKGTHRYSTKEK